MPGKCSHSCPLAAFLLSLLLALLFMAASSSYPTRSSDRARNAATQISTTFRTSPTDIATTLSPLALYADGASQEAEISAFPITSEAINFARQITIALQAAKWPAFMTNTDAAWYGITTSGISVFSQPNPRARQCAIALVAILNKNNAVARFAGITPRINQAGCQPDSPGLKSEPYCSTILIIVG